jgi:hypothetical protein
MTEPLGGQVMSSGVKFMSSGFEGPLRGALLILLKMGRGGIISRRSGVEPAYATRITRACSSHRSWLTPNEGTGAP